MSVVSRRGLTMTGGRFAGDSRGLGDRRGDGEVRGDRVAGPVDGCVSGVETLGLTDVDGDRLGSGDSDGDGDSDGEGSSDGDGEFEFTGGRLPPGPGSRTPSGQVGTSPVTGWSCPPRVTRPDSTTNPADPAAKRAAP
jgi:hypothetical protein